MSSSTLYYVYPGRVAAVERYRNSWHSAPLLWDYLGQTYLHWPQGRGAIGRGPEGLNDLWRLDNNEQVPLSLRLALQFTFDRFYIPYDYLAVAGLQLRRVGELLPTPGHWPAIGRDLERIAAGPEAPDWLGIGLGCTSVSDPWENMGDEEVTAIAAKMFAQP